MNSKEVQIRNWVQHFNGKLYQVSRVDPTHFAAGSPHLWDYNNKFHPIPLTKEILEKNGFTDYINSMYLDTKDYSIAWSGSVLKCSNDDCLIEMDNCKYVHQLQNALRLCGINKEITL